MRFSPSHFAVVRSVRGFSLIEIVLAVGIISFALIGILGLFPVALKSAANSQRETQAAIIARSIISDLEADAGDTRHILYGTSDIAENSTSTGDDSRPKFDVKLLTADHQYLSYDLDGQKPEKSSEGEYSGGSPKAGYLAEIATTTASLPTGLTKVDVTVSAPAAAPKEKRSSYPFVILLNNGTPTP